MLMKISKDQNLSIEAKGLYLYFYSFTKSGHDEFPYVGEILEDLGISKTRYYKHLKLLINSGYLRLGQDKLSGKYISNFYEVVMKYSLEGNR